jgi:hypothetical protein
VLFRSPAWLRASLPPRRAMFNLADPAQRAQAYSAFTAAELADIAQSTSGYQYTPAYFNAGGQVFTRNIEGSTVLSDDKDYADSENLLYFLEIENSANKDRILRYRARGRCSEICSIFTDPRDSVAKFQFSSPVVPGRALSTEPRKILDNFSIKVHKEARPYLERLRLDVSIDDNLILKASAFSTMQRDIDEIEIHDLEFGLSALSRSCPRKKCKTRHGRSTSKCFRWE